MFYYCLLSLYTRYFTERYCEVIYPSSYAYETNSILSTGDEDSNCSQRSIGNTQYTFCSHPIILTDGQLGPQQFNPGLYYRWDDVTARMLFTFQASVLITTIDLYYYINSTTNAGLPKLRLYLVDGFFSVSDSLSGQTSATIDPVGTPNGRNNITADLRAINMHTNQILMTIEGAKSYELTLSEIRFCTPGEKINTLIIYNI